MKKNIVSLLVFLPTMFLTGCVTETTYNPGYNSNYVYTGSSYVYSGGAGYWPSNYNRVGYGRGYYNAGWNRGYSGYNRGWGGGYNHGWGRGGGWHRR